MPDLLASQCRVSTAKAACQIALGYLGAETGASGFTLTKSTTGEAESVNLRVADAEFIPRHTHWEVAVCLNKDRIGHVVVDAHTSLVNTAKSTTLAWLRACLWPFNPPLDCPLTEWLQNLPDLKIRPNSLLVGDAGRILPTLPPESVQLVFTSPPYYNARPQYGSYLSYEDYLSQLAEVFRGCHRALAEGRFMVVNVAPVIVPRTNRNSQSQRIPLPFDVHRLMVEAGFEFMDDIIWEKPGGSGFACGRGRRFARDRQPLQYKPAPVTEYVLVYRKKTDKLLDWNLAQIDREKLRASLVPGDYERTNVWRISPARHRTHPAVMPTELAERVIRYYSVVDDIVLDPYAGTGTTGVAAKSLNRAFFLIEQKEEYAQIIQDRLKIQSTPKTEQCHV